MSSITQEAILRKRRTDDEKKNMRLDIRFRQRVDRNKKAKEEAKKSKVLVPEVFVSNFAKQ